MLEGLSKADHNIRFIDIGFKVVKRDAPKVGDGKKDFVCVLSEFLLTCTEVDLTLEYKGTKFVRTTPTKQVWFLSPPMLFGGTLARMTC